MITVAEDHAWPGLIEALRDFAQRSGFDLTVREALAVLTDRDAHNLTVTWFDAGTAQLATGAFTRAVIGYDAAGEGAAELLDFVEAVTSGAAREGVRVSPSGTSWTSVLWSVTGANGSWRSGTDSDRDGVLWRELPAWAGRPPGPG